MIASPALAGPSDPRAEGPSRPQHGRRCEVGSDCTVDDADLHGQQAIWKQKIVEFSEGSVLPAGASPMKPPADYLVALTDFPLLKDVAAAVADRVLRSAVDRPGFALLDFGPDDTPQAFRNRLLRLALALDGESIGRFHRSLRLLSVDRFDQQATTLPHRDGGPDDSVLILGYEPTLVDSRLVLLDAAHAALDRRLTTAEFLARFNPMVLRDQDVLGPYAAEALPFEKAHYRVAVINNGLSGVLHQATVVNPQPGKSRPINSLLLAGAPPAAPPLLSGADLKAFAADGTPAAGALEA
jgi:hypothetical protein